MKKLGRLLVLEGIISIGLAVLMYYVAILTSSMEFLYLPFDLLGKGLRWLSLSSSVGNWLALFLYGMLCLSPILYLLFRRLRKGFQKIDLLLPVISLFSYYMLYHFINPRLMLKWAPQNLVDLSFLDMAKLAFAIIFYSLCLAYFMLRMLETLTFVDEGDHQQSLNKGLQLILEALSVFYTFLFGYFSTYELFSELDRYSANTDNLLFMAIIPPQSGFSLNQFVVVLDYLLRGLPVIFAIYILVAAVHLIKEMATHHMETEEYQAAAKLSRAGKYAVYVTVFSNLTLNIFQFFLSSQLKDTNFNLNITLFPLIIAFGAMILAGYFKETKELHEDNEMII
jgi:hypothetical protein